MTSTTFAVARCAAALSTNANTSAAVREVCEVARESLGGPPDLALAFFSTHHVACADRLAAEACELLGTSCLLGTCGESIVGTGREVEDEPALSH